MLIMAEFPDFSLHLFGDSEFQMESSAKFPEIDATDLLEMRENNQNKNTQRSTKNWFKVFDLWHAELSEVRKLEEIPEHELDDILFVYVILVQFGNNWIQKIPRTAKLDLAYGLVQSWLSLEFFSSNYFQIGQLVVLLHVQNEIIYILMYFIETCQLGLEPESARKDKLQTRSPKNYLYLL